MTWQEALNENKKNKIKTKSNYQQVLALTES